MWGIAWDEAMWLRNQTKDCEACISEGMWGSYQSKEYETFVTDEHCEVVFRRRNTRCVSDKAM